MSGQAPLEVIRIAPALTLTTPDGAALTIREVRARIVFDGDTLRDVQLWFTVSRADWDLVDAAGWFHLAPEVRGPCFAGGFLPDVPVTVEARLGTDELTLVSLLATDLWEVGGILRGAHLHPEVHRTEAWYALNVKQPRGALQTGFLTTWGGYTPLPASAPLHPDR
jgi:hypothetical protein